MPEVSRFYGIVIQMYYREHGVPHFHAIYQGHKVVIGINPVTVIEGSIPRRGLTMIKTWARLHETELQANWERARLHLEPYKIEGLE